MTLADKQTGILLHITSLPGPDPLTGTLGKEAYRFIDTLHDHQCHLWQMLPIGPTLWHRSPYESPSSMAGNPDLIDLPGCVEKRWLSEATMHAGHQQSLSLGEVRQEASLAFWKSTQNDLDITQKLRTFLHENKHWLEDFALFSAIKHDSPDKSWWEWPEPLKNRDAAALDVFQKDHIDRIKQVYFEQFIFSEQWQELKTYAEDRSINLIGDVPIYVAHDSADVWASKNLFNLDDAGMCVEVAGVPPDYFSEAGQRWGSPLYNWKQHEADNFDWWKQRIAAQEKRFHSLRIDHFRGLESYWSIPADQPDGRVGEWRQAPGNALLGCLTHAFPDMQFIAEDLGIITPEVHQLLNTYNLPGMKILQFAFDGAEDNPYLPENIPENSVVYTGTHDNDTLAGWMHTTDHDTLTRAKEYLNATEQDLGWAMIQAGIQSPSKWSIFPMQDIFGLDQTARMNTPGTIENNWQWRFQESDFDHSGWGKLAQLI